MSLIPDTFSQASLDNLVSGGCQHMSRERPAFFPMPYPVTALLPEIHAFSPKLPIEALQSAGGQAVLRTLLQEQWFERRGGEGKGRGGEGKGKGDPKPIMGNFVPRILRAIWKYNYYAKP